MDKDINEKTFVNGKDFKDKMDEEDFNKATNGLIMFDAMKMKVVNQKMDSFVDFDIPNEERAKIFTKALERMESYRNKFIEEKLKEWPEIKRDS
jgi:hypothetical protein